MINNLGPLGDIQYRVLYELNANFAARHCSIFLMLKYGYQAWTEDNDFSRLVPNDSSVCSSDFASDSNDDVEATSACEEDCCDDAVWEGPGDAYMMSSDLVLSANVAMDRRDALTEHSCILDSGCTAHMLPKRPYFTEDPTPCPAQHFRTANDGMFLAANQGTAKIPVGQDFNPLSLPGVLYVPELSNTLISIACLDAAGYSILFSDGCATIQDRADCVVGCIPKSNGLYRIVSGQDPGDAHAAVEKLTLNKFHRRMGHISKAAAVSLVANGFVDGVSLDETGDRSVCETCVFTKLSRKSVPKECQHEKSKVFGEQTHSDVWGPSRVESRGGCRYFATFTDDATRLSQLFLMHTKSETFDSF